jgi:hypothetical protein
MSFQFFDITGEEISIGDTIAIAALWGRSPRLFLGLVTKTSVSKAQARIYYKQIWDTGERETYVTYPIHWSGRPCPEVMKISGVEFRLDQKKFARLFTAKADFDSKSNGEQDE